MPKMPIVPIISKTTHTQNSEIFAIAFRLFNFRHLRHFSALSAFPSLSLSLLYFRQRLLRFGGAVEFIAEPERSLKLGLGPLRFALLVVGQAEVIHHRLVLGRLGEARLELGDGRVVEPLLVVDPPEGVGHACILGQGRLGGLGDGDRPAERLLDGGLADDDFLHREREEPDGLGRLADALTDSWSQGASGARLTNADRAESFRSAPLPRMSNIRIEVDRGPGMGGDFINNEICSDDLSHKLSAGAGCSASKNA